MKKRKDRFERYLSEAHHIGNMLYQEGKTDAERRAYVHVATILLFIDSSLHTICLILSGLVGLVIGKLLASLL